MKLGALKTAIREMKTNPQIRFALHPPGGEPVEVQVALQKGSILEQLDLVFTQGRAQETGLCIREGFFTSEQA